MLQDANMYQVIKQTHVSRSEAIKRLREFYMIGDSTYKALVSKRILPRADHKDGKYKYYTVKAFNNLMDKARDYRFNRCACCPFGWRSK